MKLFGLIAVSLVTALMPAPVAAQSAAISSAWGTMKLSHDDCLSRAEQLFKRLKFTRVEKTTATVYGDRRTVQLGLRCVSEHGLYYIFGGDRNQSSVQVGKLIDELKEAFHKTADD